MNGDKTERIPQTDERREISEGGILESASTFAYRVLKEIEALAGTTACKSVQLVRLKKWAQEQGCWFDDNSQFGDFFDRGSENEVYLSTNGTEIIKLNDFRYSDDNLTPFFERIIAHNKYFPDCAYQMLGFAENREGHVCAVLVQPFIAEARLATEQDIHDEFVRLGFHAGMMVDTIPTINTTSLMRWMAMFLLMTMAAYILLIPSSSQLVLAARKLIIAFHPEPVNRE